MKPKENSITPSLKGAVTNYLTILKLLNMRKKIFSGLFALALLATAGFGVNQSMKSDANLSDLALANVEALADGESGNGSSCSVSITCLDGANISCSGTSCRYGRDEMHSIGYVCCNDNYTYCSA